MLRDKLVNREKFQTYRTKYIPTFVEGEIIAIKYQKKEFLYFAKITEIIPVKLGDLTLDMAIRDGFDSVKEMQDKIQELNGKMNPEQWGFIIRWCEWTKQKTLTNLTQ